MTIAIGTIVIFIFVLPGILMRRAYLSGTFSKNFIKVSLLNDVFWAIVPGFLFQFTGMYFAQFFFNLQFDFYSVGVLVSGVNDNAEIKRVFNEIRFDLPVILIFNISIWVFAVFLGYITRVTVRFLRMDRKYKFFRFNNEWHYILSGEILDFPSYGKKSEYVDYVFVDILANTSDGTHLYQGQLREYFLSGEGKLESICVGPVKRSKIGNGKNDEVDLPSDILVIPYSDIVNINVRYYKDANIPVQSRKDEAKEYPWFVYLWLMALYNILSLREFMNARWRGKEELRSENKKTNESKDS